MANKVNEGILVCETTMKNSLSRLVFSAAKSLKVKGKENLVHAYAPLRVRKKSAGGQIQALKFSNGATRVVGDDERDDNSDGGYGWNSGSSTLGDPQRSSRASVVIGDPGIGDADGERDNFGRSRSSIAGGMRRTSTSNVANVEKDSEARSSFESVPLDPTWLSRSEGVGKKGFVGRVAERVMLCGKIDALATTGDGNAIVIEVGLCSAYQHDLPLFINKALATNTPTSTVTLGHCTLASSIYV
jgi:hypothetical protein